MCLGPWLELKMVRVVPKAILGRPVLFVANPGPRRRRSGVRGGEEGHVGKAFPFVASSMVTSTGRKFQDQGPWQLGTWQDHFSCL